MTASPRPLPTPGSGAPVERRDSATPREPDYRFLLANERTFLAYLRTALGLNAAALAIDQFVDFDGPARPVLAITCAVLGLGATIAGFRRWQGGDAAIRAGRPLPRPHVVPVLASGLAIVSILVLAVVLSWP